MSPEIKKKPLRVLLCAGDAAAEGAIFAHPPQPGTSLICDLWNSDIHHMCHTSEKTNLVGLSG